MVATGFESGAQASKIAGAPGADEAAPGALAS
jgi:hypothetical protein